VRSDQKPALSRRAFAAGLTGSVAALGTGNLASAANQAEAPIDADLREAALRGLARSVDLGDPVLAARTEAVLARLQGTDPEGALLGHSRLSGHQR
jgi:hypothetical protein